MAADSLLLHSSPRAPRGDSVTRCCSCPSLQLPTPKRRSAFMSSIDRSSSPTPSSLTDHIVNHTRQASAESPRAERGFSQRCTAPRSSAGSTHADSPSPVLPTSTTATCGDPNAGKNRLATFGDTEQGIAAEENAIGHSITWFQDQAENRERHQLQKHGGRRLSCLATYAGLPTVPPFEPSSYSISLQGELVPSVLEPLSSTSRSSISPDGYRLGSASRVPARPPTPRYPSGLVASLSPLLGAHANSFDCDPNDLGPNKSSSPLHCRSSTSDNPIGADQSIAPVPRSHGDAISSNMSRSSSSASEGSQPRVVRGFDSPTSESVPRFPSPPSCAAHSISRGRAGSGVFVAGVNGGYEMEYQASRDFELLDGEKTSGERGRDGSGRGRPKHGKAAAAERLRRGYSEEGARS
ncbi:uncharacterized protein JCM15063_002848 [Sporobolomyces koalae]|uniref:uncharacterized protein n=1 Tax=Sporobolomyces koalae TaxID=500713 RepID=UPI00317DA259